MIVVRNTTLGIHVDRYIGEMACIDRSLFQDATGGFILRPSSMGLHSVLKDLRGFVYPHLEYQEGLPQYISS